MIKIKIINKAEGHILIKANEPIRIEVAKIESGYVMFGYKGTKINMNQEPTISFDTDI